ncbi:hypothetical protein BY996DRAFT_6581167 [Phakopsora pachyrhizi]|uniref:Uncharacterized protein n=1 Tax=Phakopsora pachyrhizi TaxID=170000 RepID=A0AAV0AY88_PHAPC|nr:hypothetical protein BY996DRAFT_6581167 [Phakopsora pachyrhizi]CAH7674013.1 hypothetical protein PPACK8108_LOCUS8908 [Phakopsora pachyrhizi]
MPKVLAKRQRLAYAIKEMGLQSLLESDSDSKLETDILYLNHLLTKKYLPLSIPAVAIQQYLSTSLPINQIVQLQ